MKKIVLPIAMLLAGTGVFAQGMLFDTTRYDEIKTFDPNQLRGYATGNMPTSISLRKFAPIPLDQTGNSCVGVATTYESLSILHNQALGTTNKYVNTMRAFDPYSVYNQIADAPGCSEGTYTEDAFETLAENGAKKLWMDPFLDCYSDINSEAADQAEAFLIADYKKLFDTDDDVKHDIVQKVLATGTPVVVAMYAPASLWREESGGNVGTDGLWVLDYDDRYYSWSGHAMSVIGYDDEKFGGAFEIMNSWGSDYGDEGFLWITYDDFEDMCYGAYFMTINDYRRESGCLTGDCESGYAMYRFKNGDMYEGYLTDGQFEGFGVYTYNDGSAYVGSWTQGKLDGTVVEVFANDTYRISNWADGVQDPERFDDVVEEDLDYEFLNSLEVLNSYQFAKIRVRPGETLQKETQMLNP